MDVAVSGSGGLLGGALARHLRRNGHRVVRLSRSDAPRGDAVRWKPTQGRIDAAGLEGLDAVVHLAGEPLFGRWTAAKMRRIRESRIKGTHLLARTLSELAHPPRVLLSGSGSGYYGADPGDEVLTEDDSPGDDWMAELCKGWEAATAPASGAGIRVVHLRTAPVIHPDNYLIKLQLPFFKLGLGGKLGSGRQWFPWISLTDHVRAQVHLLTTEAAHGPVNVGAPHPVRNVEFAQALGRVLGRPVLLTVPPFALAAVFGRDLVDLLATASQRMAPARLVDELGFTFEHPDLEDALRAELGREDPDGHSLT